MKRGIIMNKNDNVATILEDAAAGDVVSCRGLPSEVAVSLLGPVPRGHKVALADIREGENIVKYGFATGYALADIPKGAHVHVHNVGSRQTEEQR